MGSAWATLICYASMTIACWWWGRKYYPVDYDLKKIAGYIGLAIALVFISHFFVKMLEPGQAITLIFNTLLMGIFILAVWKAEGKAIRGIM